MAFRSSQVTVTTTAVKIFEAIAGDLDIWVGGDENVAVWLGGSDVTDVNGLRLFGPSDRIHTDVRPGDELWAVASTSTTVNVLARSA